MKLSQKVLLTVGIIGLFLFLLWWLGRDAHCSCKEPGYECVTDSISTITYVIDTVTGQIKCSYIDHK